MRGFLHRACTHESTPGPLRKDDQVSRSPARVHAAAHWLSLRELLSPVYLSVDGLVRSASLLVRDLSCPLSRKVGTLPDAWRVPALLQDSRVFSAAGFEPDLCSVGTCYRVRYGRPGLIHTI